VSKHIRFDRTKFESKGRNGYIDATGINVVERGDELFLEPVTTRGINSEACRIVQPRSAITALIEALAEIARCSSQSPAPDLIRGQAIEHLLTPSGGGRGGLRARSQSPQEQPNASLHHRTAVSAAGVSASGCRGAGPRSGMP
jgi:hypothetical protein